MAKLEIDVGPLRFPNPFVLASGPPGTNAKVIKRSFGLGWGGIVCKTISLDNSKVINTVPRYEKLRARGAQDEVIGFQNIELISDRPYADWLDDLRQLKKNYPNKILIASIMEEYNKDTWQRITREVQETGGGGWNVRRQGGQVGGARSDHGVHLGQPAGGQGGEEFVGRGHPQALRAGWWDALG